MEKAAAVLDERPGSTVRSKQAIGAPATPASDETLYESFTVSSSVM